MTNKLVESLCGQRTLLDVHSDDRCASPGVVVWHNGAGARVTDVACLMECFASPPPPASAEGHQLTREALARTTAPDLQKRWGMANQAPPLETASTKQNRNIKPVAPKELQPRPPVKKLPPPDEDVLFFLPIG